MKVDVKFKLPGLLAVIAVGLFCPPCLAAFTAGLYIATCISITMRTK